MPKKRIAINGFGRIGRLTLRELLAQKDIEVVAINDLTSNETLAHLFKYDTMQGKFNGSVTADEHYITVKGKKILSLSVQDPAALPWKKLKVDTVLECTGIFRTEEKAGLHLKAGAKKVIISAPGKGGNIPTIVLGINEKSLKKSDKIFSNASCTTNCLAPMMAILDEHFGVEQASISTIHAYTSDQNIQDAPHSDLRRARAAAQSIIPTSTGAANATQVVLPQLKGKLSASALRVPVATGSLTDVTCMLKKEVTAKEINKVFKKASEAGFKGILEYCVDPIVSADIVGNPHSCIFDSLLTEAHGKMVKVVGWYDNEAGYSSRLADMTVMS